MQSVTLLHERAPTLLSGIGATEPESTVVGAARDSQVRKIKLDTEVALVAAEEAPLPSTDDQASTCDIATDGLP